MKNHHCITRRQVVSLGTAALAMSAIGPARAADEKPVLVELFTSQGCSSCPPADALLEELRAMPGVVALTYHVDYWDYLGWQDTLGSAENSQRQYDYAKARGDMDVYTPQMIVNGASHHVGSQRSTVLAAIDEARQVAWPIAMSIRDSDREIVVDVGEGQPAGDTTIWLLPLVRTASVKILKGEIAGREIVYHNVVRKLLPAGMWTGKATQLVLPKDGVLPPDCQSCVAVLQAGKAGKVLGCAAWGEIGA